MSVSEFLFNLESEIGKITDIESVCPGTYYFTARQNGESISHEYYLVMEDSPVFHSIKKYGKQIQKFKLVDIPALMNVIWKRAPEYALINNVREQAGLNDFISGLFHGFGVEVEPHCSIDHMFSVFPDAGEDFLLFEGF